MITLSSIKTEKPDPNETNSGVYSLGLVIPFQPSMTERKFIKAILDYTIEMVDIKLSALLNQEDLFNITKRIERIFENLNYNSHRKSVAIIIKGEEEKIIYLNYSGKPAFLFNDSFSLLDLVGNSIQNPEFQLLAFKEDGAELYEYFNNSLHKVFSQTAKSCREIKSGSDCLIKKISNIIKQINFKNDKPIFIFSENEQQTTEFCEFFPFKEIAFKINISPEEDEKLNTKIQMLVSKITNQWKYQQTKLINGQLRIAKRTKTIISHLNQVLGALKNSDDGLLLIDSYMKDEIHNTLQDETLFVATKKLNDEIEKFLDRGNKIQITKGGALESLGGIALIKDTYPKFEFQNFPRKYNLENLFIY